MTLHVHPSLLPTPTAPVLLHYRDAAGARQFTPAAAAASIAFEDTQPVRDVLRYKGQWNTPGVYWSATGRRQLQYESYLECKWMTIFDFDPDVVAMSAQPLHIQCLDAHQSWEHTPDLFLRLRDGGVRVVDVKNPGKVGDVEVLLQAARTQAVCNNIGWDYALVAEPDVIPWLNVQWLAGYRRPFVLPEELTPRILRLAAVPVPIADLVEAFPVPEFARTAVMRACWFGELEFDLRAPLRDTTLLHSKEMP